MASLATILTRALLVLPAFAVVAPAALPVLVPWVVSSLASLQPSGRPGSPTDFTLNVTISDPNFIPIGRASPGAAFAPSTATCAAAWNYATKPWGKPFACRSSEKSASWKMTVVEPEGTDITPSATHYFDLRFEETRKMKIATYTASKAFAAQGNFEYRKNLNVVCGASGVCSGALIPGTKVELVPRRTDCDEAPLPRGDGDC